MKLWLLRPAQSDRKGTPWDPWYDKAFGFVVRAETESDARKFCDEDAGDENRGGVSNPWLDPSWSTCEELTSDGEPGVVIQDFASA